MNKNSPSEAKWMEMDNVMLSKARNTITKQNKIKAKQGAIRME